MADLRYGIAGGFAGIVVDIVFYPLETIKTRIMATTLKENLRSIAVSKFRGFSTQMIVSFPYSFTFFYVYETVRAKFNKTVVGNAIASSCAEVFANIVRNPFQIVKQQMMVGRSENIGQSLQQIYRTKGIRGFYTGYNSALVRDIMFSAIQLPLFEYFRTALNERLGYNKIICASIGGMASACIAGFISCPLDVIKTRLMTQKMQQQASLNVIKQIYSDYGIKGFFKGATFRSGILSFGGIVYFGALQRFRQMMNLQ